MQNYNCPSCGAGIAFQSSVSVSCICPFCKSLVVRRDKDVEAMGKMAELPQDISPFQLGTTGIYHNTHFTLIGRMKIGWEDGNWNEWFMFSDDGRKGWLAEAQGFLAISFEKEESALPVSAPKLNQVLTIEHTRFSVADIKQAECIGSEGELPFIAPKGRKTTSVDLIGYAAGFACIEYDEQGKSRFYIGEYVEFDALKFGNLRELPGWDDRMAQGKAAS